MNDELYFKDAFTETDGEINFDGNNININCITSKNNKFSLDSDGNLVVNSITTTTQNGNVDFDSMYPVGSIYLSLVNTNPATLFGGVWEQIAKGRTLVGVDTSQDEFNTVKKEGGEKNHILSIDEMPSHTHNIYDNSRGDKPSFAGFYAENGKMMRFKPTYTNLTDNTDAILKNEYEGGSQSHNNLQPYITCYIWTRVS